MEGFFDTQKTEAFNKKVINSIFRDNDMFNFKYGLASNQKENLDEDPVIYGFDIVIHDVDDGNDGNKDVKNKSSNDVMLGRGKGDYGYSQKFTSPLVNGAIINFMDSVGNTEVLSKKDIYNDFLTTFRLFFNDTRNGFTSFKSHYLKSVKGLHGLVENVIGFGKDNKQFTEYGKDKIVLDIYEDTFLNSGYLAALYKNIVYSRVNGKLLIPENLLKFDMSIIISEIRNFNLVVDTTSKLFTNAKNNPNVPNSNINSIAIFNDNISRYIYNLYDCQLNFPQYSHDDEVRNDSREFTDSFQIEIYYKFSTMEMEKFKYDPLLVDKRYINNANINNPSDKNDSVKNSSDIISSLSKQVTNEDDRTYDLRYRRNAPYIQYSKNNDIEESRPPDTGLQKVFNNTKKFALTRIRQERDSLINKTLDNIRTNVGLRRISSPINVYDTDPRSITDYFFGQVRDFANDSVTGVLKKANDKLGDISKNIDIERLKSGKDAINTGKYSGTDQDVRKAAGISNDVNVYYNKK